LKNKKVRSLSLIPIEGIPDVQPNDNIGRLIVDAISKNDITLNEGDIVVVTQKIVSKAEDRYIDSSSITPSKTTYEMASITQKSPALIELIIRESRQILRQNERTIIVEHKLGFICANAGIDQSNVRRDDSHKDGARYLLLPKNPDRSAYELRSFLESTFGAHIGVMIIDSHGRAWRYGTVGTTIGISGVPGVVDLRGKPDLYGRTLKITRIGAADELAGAASLVMGQAAENIPVVIARGFPYALRNAQLNEIIRAEEMDLFR